LKASVEYFRERAYKLKDSLGDQIPPDWKARLSKEINNVEFIRALNQKVHQAQLAKL
jgi:hypothetical protein